MVINALNAAGLRAVSENTFTGNYDSQSWIVGYDGSVEGTNAMEIKSPILQGTEGFRAIRTFSKTMLELDVTRPPTVNKSCGLHVHIGIANAEKKFIADEILMIMERYTELKPEIDKLLAKSRRSDEDNDYCMDFDSSVRNVGDYIADLDVRTRRRALDNNTLSSLADCADHYDAVSIQALDKYGTIEFRQHQGTLSGEKITNWIRFLLTHVDVSRFLVKQALDARDAAAVERATAALSGVRRASAPGMRPARRTPRARSTVAVPVPFGKPAKHELFDGQPKRVKDFFIKRREELASEA
jgi:hypothetical protein